MSWEAEIEELRRREALTEARGGADKVERQHYDGKLIIRERLHAIVDKGMFHEFGKLAGASFKVSALSIPFDTRSPHP
jgi:propionyl-CoA carboxylase beta chain